MLLATPPTPESIEFEVEGSADRTTSSGIAFTVEAGNRAPSNTPPKPNSTAHASAAAERGSHPHPSRLSRARKATAADLDTTSFASLHSSLSASQSDTSSQRTRGSAPTSFVSSSTIRTASLSHPHPPQRFASRQTFTSIVSPGTARDVSLARARSPRVAAVLRGGGPLSRGRHSISPMAPDAPRAPPAELQGPPRYLRERGLTPSPSAIAARRRSSARRAADEKRKDSSNSTPEKKKGRKGRRSASRTPSPGTVSSGGSRGRHSHPLSGRSHEKDHKHRHHHNRHRDAAEPTSKAKRNGKKEKTSAREARVLGRGTVLAPACDTVDSHSAATAAAPSLRGPPLTVQQLEQQQQQLGWNARDALSSTSFQSLHRQSPPVGGRDREGAARGADIRAPPPRANSPSNRLNPRPSLGPAGRESARDRSQRTLDDASNKRRGGSCSGLDEDTAVDLTVPVLSAHHRARTAWPASTTRRGSGPPGPAAWDNDQRRGSGDPPTSSRCRYGGCDDDGDDVHANDRAQRSSSRTGVAPPPGAYSLPPSAQQQQPAFPDPADSVQHPSHRFGLPSSSAGAGGGGARFSASPHLAGASPILDSYVAQSFNSSLPGHSTVLGGGGGAPATSHRHARAAGVNSARKRSLLKHSKQDQAEVELEVAVLAESVEELPPTDTLEHYAALLRRYEAQQQQQQQRRAAPHADDGDIASLFGLVVHMVLPSQATPADALNEEGAAPSSTEAAQPPSPVTIGAVKDEVALRTGIPALQQCLVYEAMSLQDSLPVHLLLSAAADDEEEGEEGDDAEGRRLRLLCVPLKADATPTWPSPRRRSSVAGAGAETRHVRAPGGNEKEADTASDDVDDLTSLLLLSPVRHGVSTTQTAPQDLPGSTTEAAPVARRGAVPFTLSDGTIASPATTASATVKRIQNDAAAQRSGAPGTAQEAVSRHIDRLRRLYLDDGNRDPNDDDAAASAAAAAVNTNGYDASSPPSMLPPPRDYLLHPAYQLNQTGGVESADPVVHALQQRLLLSELTAPSTTTTTTGTGGSSRAIPAVYRGAAAAALSDALLAALPAPPVRRPNSHISGGGVAVGRGGADGVISGYSAPTAAALAVQRTQPTRRPSTATPTSSTAAAAAAEAVARTRFAIHPLPTSTNAPTPTLSAATGPTVSSAAVQRRTARSEGFYPQKSALPDAKANGSQRGSDTEDSFGGGVDASWLSSSHASAYSARDAGEVGVAMSPS
ncbi:hypothetical protein ABB37_04264 [Leptomonas pyrrhocoris]|uniref:Ubiquitin-like domain-containing protein n=1 Tax=Leptomonas pyrrhocoris TaxID=157538 RepID=A0A0M9G2I9_LEPPY|nr:hypothetical protein ABB37_04264 [Leptomonas pyrrhocoris]XP_015659279.1 hypothetical protein ABB37_04264 [Leptomonas pyrrhocoris]KPA80839.1 hypothetical protein ABB37_04264 [Leptomonas pyrrhocoris]KPA80840.1 hypothetical protein ABB37_04264 [Leptomonas pyrrhocoris]|eukprot:XP_015659278.1 hypothetical protein ABB37_04264 [Leptomonas pyrrhocoris]